LETAFAVCHDHLVRRKVINLARLIDLLSCGPARVFKLPGGTLRAGALGDITIVDPDARHEVTRPFASKAGNSPFVGLTLQGRVAATIVGGVVRYGLEGGRTARSRRASRPKLELPDETSGRGGRDGRPPRKK